MNPLTLMSLHRQVTSLVLETQTVMALRLMGISGMIPARRGENRRMFEEKPAALFDAYAEGVRATMAGKRPDEILSASMAPLGRKVHANRVRLMK